jgi:BirA family biotin operon repressor/biotin-[acetyl-CoA-carboxylase] ligase
MIKKLNWEYDAKYSFFLVDEIESTNTYFKEHAEEYPDKSVLIALRQTKGRGRYNRVWESKDDITFSILLKHNASYNVIAPLALCLALYSLGYDTGIKWPNDIYLQNKKLAGILIEDLYQITFNSAIIGIGLNMSDKEEYNAIGLNSKLSKYEIIDTILVKLDELLQMDIKDLIELYRKKSIVIGRMVYYHDKLFKAIGVSDLGYLILKNDKEEICISCDEINLKESLR